MLRLEIIAKKHIYDTLAKENDRMLTETILNSLASDFFVSLHNDRTQWRLTYCNPGIESGTLTNNSLDDLLEDWRDMLAQWEATA